MRTQRSLTLQELWARRARQGRASSKAAALSSHQPCLRTRVLMLNDESPMQLERKSTDIRMVQQPRSYKKR